MSLSLNSGKELVLKSLEHICTLILFSSGKNVSVLVRMGLSYDTVRNVTLS